MEMLTAVNGGNKDRFGEAYGKKTDPACSAGMRMHDMDVVFPDEPYKKPDIFPSMPVGTISDRLLYIYTPEWNMERIGNQDDGMSLFLLFGGKRCCVHFGAGHFKL
jgi:hypothetical protein